MAGPSYDQTQGELQQRFEGEDFHIDAPKEGLPEVNPEVYKDVDPLLFRGFLIVPAEINGVSFVFKSLNHHEFNLLSLMATLDSRKAETRFYSTFLAHGVFMVDGINILPNRDQHLPKVIEFFQSLEKTARDRVVLHLSEINKRANRAVALSEAFSLETASRIRWAQMKGIDVTSTAVTGIQGTSNLGMNWAQLTWRAINHFEDIRDKAEREWENAKFIASAMAGKGMNKVHSQDKRRREQEQTERQEKKDKILRFALLGEPLDQASKGVPVMVARTVDELADQLTKDLKGEKDWHDMVVDAYEAQARQERQAKEERLHELRTSFDERFGEKSLVGGSSMEGLTPEEVKYRLERQRQLAAQRLSAQQVYPELFDPKSADFSDKWNSPQQTTPTPIVGVPNANRPAGKPFKR